MWGGSICDYEQCWRSGAGIRAFLEGAWSGKKNRDLVPEVKAGSRWKKGPDLQHRKGVQQSSLNYFFYNEMIFELAFKNVYRVNKLTYWFMDIENGFFSIKTCNNQIIITDFSFLRKLASSIYMYKVSIFMIIRSSYAYANIQI